jgi:hypothetical protein
MLLLEDLEPAGLPLFFWNKPAKIFEPFYAITDQKSNVQFWVSKSTKHHELINLKYWSFCLLLLHLISSYVKRSDHIHNDKSATRDCILL